MSDAIWPGLTYDIHDAVTANLFRAALRARMEDFSASLSAGFDYQPQATADFNSWIRHEVPYYQTHAAIADLHDLEFMSKAQIRSCAAAFVNPNVRDTFRKRTTGSTGPPQEFRYSAFFHHETVLLAAAKVIRRLGLEGWSNARVHTLTIRDKPAEPPFARFDPTGLAGSMLRVGVDTTRPSEILGLAERASRIRPFCISSGPAVLAAFAAVVPKSLASKMETRLIISGGAHLPGELRTRLATLFGARVTTAYGLSEFGVVASECRCDRLHINTADCHAEIRPLETAGSHPDGVGEIVITSTKNRAMPFMRYRTGDLGRLDASRCDCGEPSPVLHLAAGRMIPSFRLPGGTVFSPTQFRDVFDRFGFVREFQITQTDIDRFEILIEIDSSESDLDSLMQRVTQHFSNCLGSTVALSVKAHHFAVNEKFQRYRSLLADLPD